MNKLDVPRDASHRTASLLRCLGPLAVGANVVIVGAAVDIASGGLSAAVSLTTRGWDDLIGIAPGSSTLVVVVEPEANDWRDAMPDLSALLTGGATLAVWSADADAAAGVEAGFSAHYVMRDIAGAVVSDDRFSDGRIVALQNSVVGRQADMHLLLLSATALRQPLLGLFEDQATGQGVPARVAPLEGARSEPAGLALDEVDNSRAASLARRLIKVEDRTVALRGEIMRLKSQLDVAPGPGSVSSVDVPRTRHSWPLADNPARGPLGLGLYDRRPDDAIILEAQLGEVFADTFRLLTDDPDYAGAVADLNATAPALGLQAATPDVSIIIPVYGQLAYTLISIQSLLHQQSRYSAEIIIVDDCSPDGATADFVPQIRHIRYHRQVKNGGFIASCNSGGALARGTYVLMLNSDTRVAEHWLDELLDSFASFPKAGLVGSKMLYPDGMLQEAGGILWRDGSAWNYGRGDDPNRPNYCFARQVDYISGCSIALPRALWDELGGFDPHYTPAYAEDADMCQRVKARGLEVWYQPTSRVVHYEGKTSGTSTTSGTKAYQIVNLKKLFLRWRAQMEHHRRNGDNPQLERERGVRKRILFVDAVTPTPNQDAGSLQTALILRCAQASGYKAHFVPEDNWLFDPVYTPPLMARGIECAYAPFEVGLDNYLRRYGALFDVVVVFRVTVIEKCLPVVRKYAPQAVLLFHLADLHYLRQQRQALLDGDEAGLAMAEKLKIVELDAVRQSDGVITHSTVEADILAAETPDAPVTVWPLMLEFAGTTAAFESRRDICFLGGYRHPPNIDAVIYFVNAIFPIILRARPEMRFIVAGANPTPDILDLASDKVIVTGMIDDLAEVFDATRVFVCPLRVGAGAKGKIMSALSHGLPIVSTAVGIEGAGLTDGVHALERNDPESFAEAVLRLYDDPVLWNAMSLAGQAVVRDDFSLDLGRRKLEEAVEKGYAHVLGLAGQ